MGTWICRNLTAVTIAVAVSFGAACADSVRYDSEACATNAHDQVFVRLQSGLVFALPADDLLMLRGAVEEPGPIADRTEPKGCPLNPIITSGFAVAYRPVSPLFPDEPKDARWRPQVLQIFGHSGPTRTQDSTLRFFDRYCVNKPETDPREHYLVDVSPGLRDCRVEQVDRPDDQDWPSYLVARPGTHPEFGGRLFAIHCDRPIIPGTSRDCSARYQIEDGLSVMYRFQDAVVPREHMAEFDLQVRAFVDARRASEYDLDMKQ